MNFHAKNIWIFYQIIFFDFFFQIKDQNKSQNEEKIEKVCRLSKLRGDGICDDEANVYECDFDGGDCCAPNSIMDFCLQCQCYGNCLIWIYS